jgi:tetratricopeptide (TPR) repeat protein
LNDFSEAIRINPKNVEAYVLSARIRIKQGRFEEAIRDYRKALELDPANTSVLNSLAWQYLTCKKPELRNPASGMELAKKAVRLEKSAPHLDTLACGFAETGDFEKAIELAKKAFELEPLERYRRRIRLFQANKTYTARQKEIIEEKRRLELKQRRAEIRRQKIWEEIVRRNEAARRKKQKLLRKMRRKQNDSDEENSEALPGGDS